MGILSGVLIALGGLMFQVARHNRQSAAAGYRSAAVMTAASWASGMSWDSIDGAVGCQSDTIGPMVYARCTSVQTSTPRSKQITIVVSPTGALVAQPETVVVQRAKPRSPSPFNAN